MADYVGIVLLPRPSCLPGNVSINITAMEKPFGPPTVRPCDLPPNYSNLGPTDFSLRSVDKRDFFAEIESKDRQNHQTRSDYWSILDCLRSCFGIVNTLNLNQTFGAISMGCGLLSGLLIYLVPGFVLRFPLW